MSAPPIMPHEWSVRVYYEDTDAGGVVYHARHLAFCERARTELLRAVCAAEGTTPDALGVAFVVRRCAIEYHAPARLDDLLTVVTEIARIGGASLDMLQTIRRGPAPIAAAEVALVAVTPAFRPARVPALLRRLWQTSDSAADATQAPADAIVPS